jgi:phage shock protein E
MRKLQAIVGCTLAATLLLVSAGVRPALLAAADKRVLKNISVEEAVQLIQEHGDDPDFVILDVRTPGEFASGHLEGAVNIDYYDEGFKQKIGNLDRGKTYLVYCRSGSRSSRAFALMKSLGFSTVYEMRGGITAWMESGQPVVQ